MEVIYFFFGKNKKAIEFDMIVLENIIDHIARQISVKQLHHYWQIAKAEKFCQFDYDINNQKMYNSSSAPCYNLKNVKVPTFMYSGGCDT